MLATCELLVPYGSFLLNAHWPLDAHTLPLHFEMRRFYRLHIVPPGGLLRRRHRLKLKRDDRAWVDDPRAAAAVHDLETRLAALRADNERARAIANTADSLVKAEKAAQERLAQQVRQLESDNHALQADLGFFEGLLPVAGEGLQLRGLQADMRTPGRLRYQLLLMQAGRATVDFSGRFDLVLVGQGGDGKPWTQTSLGPKPLQFRQYARLEGSIDLPPEVVLKTVQARVYDQQGTVRANQTAKL